MSNLFKRRKVSPSRGSRDEEAKESDYLSSSSDISVDDIEGNFIESASQWNLEQDYEQRPRKQAKQVRDDLRLPIKTADGVLRTSVLANPVQDDDESKSDGTEEVEGQELRDLNDAVESGPMLSPYEQIIQAKEQLAKLAGELSMNPEDNVAHLKHLADITNSPNDIVRQLAIATRMTVFKDIIPGYRIRPLTELDQQETVTKEVKKLRMFEQTLVKQYQEYLRDLDKFSRGSDSRRAHSSQAEMGKLAISCACTLLLAVPHFNFRAELLKIIVGKMGMGRRDALFTKCIETMEEFFGDDQEGTASLEAVSVISKMLKAKNFDVDESVLNCFLQLPLLTEFNSKASYDRVDKTQNGEEARVKVSKSKRQFLTKRQRKAFKANKAVDKDFREADAVVSEEQRDHSQAEMLKMVFATYFRILKLRSPRLMGAVLEGLATYAHLINQDFFGDLLEVFRELVQRDNIHHPDTHAADAAASAPLDDEEQSLSAQTPLSINHTPLRHCLLCISTAFALLEGQDVAKSAQALNLDLTFFIARLYRILHPLSLTPDIEEQASRRKERVARDRAAAAAARNGSTVPTSRRARINVQTTTVLLVRALSAILLQPRNVQPLRLAAFTKQLYTCALHLPEKSDLAILEMMENIAKLKGRKITSLWNTEERKGDGVFDPYRGDCEGSNPFAGTIWEGELLRLHFSPKVRDASKAVEKGVRCAV